MNRKIAIIIERADITLGGAERSVFELRAALYAIGYTVDILAAKGRTNAKNIYILCKDTSGKRINYFVFEKAIRQHLYKNKYDIIHSVLPFDFADVYQPRGGTYAETIIRSATSYQNIFIQYYKRLTAITNSRRTTLLRAERKLSQAPDGPVIAALSEYVAKQFKQHYKTDTRRIVVIPNGVKTDKRIDPAHADKLRSQILAKLNLKEADNPALFLFVANNFRLKGLLPLILPTFYDPSSRFILEALAADKPVITTKFNGAADLFVNNRHGKIIDSPDDIEALTDAITYFTDTNNIQTTSQAIIEDNLKEEISISRVAKQLHNVYDSILQRKGRE